MDMAAYIDEIKFKLGYPVLKIELDDSMIEKIVNSAFREIQRYMNTTRIATIPYAPCIDLSKWPISSVSAVFRAKGYLNSSEGSDNNVPADPIYMAQWQMLAGGLGSSAYSMQDFAYNYGAWNTTSQIRNTLSTDLVFRYDKFSNKLYVNVSFDKPEYITIEYIPRLDNVEQIVSDFWIDKLCRLSVALAKQTIGRIRSKYTQTNSLMQLDGATLLEEGNAELTALREELVANTEICYPLD